MRLTHDILLKNGFKQDNIYNRFDDIYLKNDNVYISLHPWLIGNDLYNYDLTCITYKNGNEDSKFSISKISDLDKLISALKFVGVELKFKI